MYHSSSPSNDVILDVDHVWKIYCRNLKRAMRYGLYDLARQMIGAGRDRSDQDLRPGEFFAVRDANFQLSRGQCIGMIGPNGAGKSSMLKMINGLIKPDSGQIMIRGKIGALIELGSGFNPILSGRENIYINGTVLGMQKREIDRRFDQIVDFAELGHVIGDPVKTYSSGMRMRLAFSVAANLRPQLLLMDEILAVGDVGFRMKCFAHLRKLVDAGVSIILVTHAIGMLPRVANRAIVFGNGKIVHDGDLQTGCAVYEEMMGVTEESKKKRPDEVASKSRAWIDKVEVAEVGGTSRTEYETGETINLRIHLGCEKPVKQARLIAALSSPVHGVLSSISSPYQNVQFDLHPPGRVVTLQLKQIPLLVGAYHFTVSLYGPETTDFCDRRSGQGRFRVVGPETDADGHGINGIVALNHDWMLDA